MKCTLFEDREHPGDFRVEATDDDGGCEVAIFSGPRAFERAEHFAISAVSDAFYDRCDVQVDSTRRACVTGC
jgi:hypothetical protein